MTTHTITLDEQTPVLPADERLIHALRAIAADPAAIAPAASAAITAARTLTKIEEIEKEINALTPAEYAKVAALYDIDHLTIRVAVLDEAKTATKLVSALHDVALRAVSNLDRGTDLRTVYASRSVIIERPRKERAPRSAESIAKAEADKAAYAALKAEYAEIVGAPVKMTRLEKQAAKNHLARLAKEDAHLSPVEREYFSFL